MKKLTSLTALLCLTVGRLTAAAPVPDDLLKLSPVPGGLVVHAGARSAEFAVTTARTGPWLVAVIPLDAVSATSIRETLDKEGLSGQVRVLDGPISSKLPFATHGVTALVVDGDALGKRGPDAAEVNRVLRPNGVARISRDGVWTAATKARPTGMDDWAQFHGDATLNDRSDDTLIAQPRSLQWSAGASRSHQAGVRTNGNVVAYMDFISGKRGTERLVGRDPFNGIQLWQSEHKVASRFCFLMDKEHIYLHAQSGKVAAPMLVLDAQTGKDVRTLDQGFVVASEAYQEGGIWSKATWPQAVLTDGVLIQVWGDTMWALDAPSGKLLWKTTLADGDKPYWAAAAAGLVVCSEGPGFGTAGNYIHGFNRTTMRRVVARDLKTGVKRWTWNWEGPVIENALPKVSHLVIGDGRVGLSMIRKGTPTKSSEYVAYLVNLDLKTGKQVWQQEWTGEGVKGIQRHGYFRTSIFAGQQWEVRMAVPRGRSLADGTPTVNKWALDFRCHPARTTPNYIFSSLSVTSIGDDRYYFNESARSTCDLGTFPANGLLYQTATECGCFAWMPATNAFSSEAPPEPIANAERTQRGKAGPATVPGRSWPAPGDWPMHLRDPKRSAWVDTELPSAPTIAWTLKLGTTLPSSALLANDWVNHPTFAGTVSAPSMAEGIAIVALSQVGAVIGIDPTTGQEKWRTPIAGRVDSAPTIYRGVVLVGTRLGWVYGLNRETGEMIWRFVAAPTMSTIVSHGQVESCWPVSGSVQIVDGLAWVAAGRELSMNGGIWWWGLDPLSGAIKRQGHTGFDGEWLRESTMPMKGKRPDREQGRLGGAVSPPVSDGTNLYMQTFGIELASGKRLPGPNHFGAGWTPEAPRVIVPGNFGFASDGRTSDNRHGSAMLYADLPAEFIAVRDKEIIALGIERPHVQSRENPGGSHLQRRSLNAMRDAKLGWTTLVWSTNPGMVPARRGDPVAGAQAMAVTNDIVVTAIGLKLRASALADGQPKWEVSLPAKAVFAGLAVANGQIIVTCDDGSLVGIR